jgi:hypothetical protein
MGCQEASVETVRGSRALARIAVLVALGAAACVADPGSNSSQSALTHFVPGEPVADTPMTAGPQLGSGGQPAAGSSGMAAPPPPVQGSGGSIAPPPVVMGSGGAPVLPGTGGMGTNGVKPPQGTGGAGVAGMGAVGMGGSGGMGATTGGSTLTMLTFEVMTMTQNGRYAPKNVGAIWIEDSSGKWVYTLDYWNGPQNTDKLQRYNSVSGPKYVQPFFFIPPDAVWPAPADVVTTATLPAPSMHTAKWNLKDKSGSVVPDGMYKLVIELTESDLAGKFHEIPFMKGSAPVMVMDSTPEYSGMKLTVQ